MLRHARAHFRIETLGELFFVELSYKIEHAATIFTRHAIRVAQVQHGITTRTQTTSLMLARQKSAAPEARAQRLHVADALGDHHDKTRQIRVHAAQPVAHPRTETRSSWLLTSGLEEGDARLVIDRLRVHRVDEAQLFGHAARVRQQLGEIDAVFVVGVAIETKLRGCDRKARLTTGHGGDALPVANRRRKFFVETRVELRLVVIEIKLTRRAFHVQIDDALRFRCEVRTGSESRRKSIDS